MSRLWVKSFRSLVNYGSHIPVLARVMALTTGDALEMGMGINSTPLMHWLCATTKRHLVSYESSRDQAAQWEHFAGVNTPWHEIRVVEQWADAAIERPWDVAFIDHDPGIRRHEDVARLAQRANYIIIHDADGRDDPKHLYSKIYPLFKWQFRYTAYRPHTAVLSNFVDLSEFHV